MIEKIFTSDISSLLNYPLLNNYFINNRLGEYLLSLFSLIILFAIIFCAKKILNGISQKYEKSKEKNESKATYYIKWIKFPFIYYFAFYYSISNLYFGEIIDKSLFVLLLVMILWQIVKIAVELTGKMIMNFLIDPNDKKKIPIETIKSLIGIIFWTMGLLFILSNLGINIITLIAGLGVGGAALAIGLQNILQDLFSSFAIYMDKPFSVGDFIIVGENSGTVKKIGIKTTRIKSLQGEEIIITNRELTGVRIQNFRSMKERRVVFNIGVAYETNQKILEQIPALIRDIIEKTELSDFQRAHLSKFDQSAINYEVVYFVKSGDYGKYMDTNQKIHLAIIDAFKNKGIKIAYPTQTIYLEK